MSALGGQLGFGLRISAENDTARGLASSLSGITSFLRSAAKPVTIPIRIARSGLGLLRDVNLGLAPALRLAARGLNGILDRGGELEVRQKAFSSLTGKSAAGAGHLAKELQRASSGMLGFGDAMALGNRALASGMSFSQLATAIEFIGKKSVATGKDARQSLDTVITGLVRGSTLFLDDFGILVDGLDGVKRSYDAIHGSGAFESLGPAAQKAETVRQAISEMNAQMGKINISGRETIFITARIRNQLSDGVDRLLLAAAKSDKVKESLRGVRDTVEGITNHLQGGGSLSELIFGKGQSGGIFGIIKGGLLDAGEALGRGIFGGLLKGIGTIGGLLIAGFNNLKGQVGDLWEGFKQKAGEALDRFPAIAKTAFTEVVDTLTYLPQAMKDVFGPFIGDLKSAMLEGAGFLKDVFVDFRVWLKDKLPSVFGDAEADVVPADQPTLLRAAAKGMATAWNGFWRGIGRALDYITGQNNVGPGPVALAPLPSNPLLAAAVAAQLSAFGPTSGGASGFFGGLRQSGEKILSGGIFGGKSRAKDAYDRFREEFPAQVPTDPRDTSTVIPSPYRLTMHARMSALRRAGVLESQLRNIQGGGAFTRQQALRDTAVEVARLRGEGNFISPRDRREIFERMLRQRQDAAAGPINDELSGIRARILASDARREINRERLGAARASFEYGDQDRRRQAEEQLAEAAKFMRDSVARSEATVALAMGQIGRFMDIMAGAENEMQKIAGNK
ncbi:MAG: hypothetical protein HS101_16170 [Planctomycetia bacterium]|nr:hypothetical protein [Planctomycetia bacterium]MCC7315116.1 hypothetical protein [Planctomycetota bacterium]